MHETAAPAPETAQNLRWVMPANTQQVLQLILEWGNVSYTDAEGRQVAGHWNRPGPILPCSGPDLIAITSNKLLTGERELMMTTRAGRHFTKHGSLLTFDDRLMDYDLAAWGRGDIDYQIDELAEGVEGYLHELVITRGEALIVLLKTGVISVAEARRDV
jgi:hypothetical protein